MVRISGRHANIYLASPHVDFSATDKKPALEMKTSGTWTKYQRSLIGVSTAAKKSPWTDISDWVRSIDLNSAGATEQVTGLNKLAHERIKLLYDLTGTINGTVGTEKNLNQDMSIGSVPARQVYSGDHASGGAADNKGNPFAPRPGDESAYIMSNAANSDFTYDLWVEFGRLATQKIRLLAEVLITSFNVQRGDDGSLRFTSDFELAGGEPALWESI